MYESLDAPVKINESNTHHHSLTWLSAVFLCLSLQMPTLPPKLKLSSFQLTKILFHEPFSHVSFCEDTSCFLWPLLNPLDKGFSRRLPLSTVWVNWALRNTGLNCACQLTPGTFNTIAPSLSWVSHLQIQHTADWKQYLRIPNSSFPTASKILFWGPWWVQSTDSMDLLWLRFGGVQGYMRIFNCAGVPNPCAVQGSTVFVLIV